MPGSQCTQWRHVFCFASSFCRFFPQFHCFQPYYEGTNCYREDLCGRAALCPSGEFILDNFGVFLLSLGSLQCRATQIGRESIKSYRLTSSDRFPPIIIMLSQLLLKMCLCTQIDVDFLQSIFQSQNQPNFFPLSSPLLSSPLTRATEQKWRTHPCLIFFPQLYAARRTFCSATCQRFTSSTAGKAHTQTELTSCHRVVLASPFFHSNSIFFHFPLGLSIQDLPPRSAGLPGNTRGGGGLFPAAGEET